MNNNLLNINKIIDILEPVLEVANSNKEINLSANIIDYNYQNKIIRWFTFHNLKSLNLYHTNLFVKVVTLIASALNKNTTLTELNISNNVISSDNAIKISDALKINTTLTKLDLGCTRLHSA